MWFAIGGHQHVILLHDDSIIVPNFAAYCAKGRERSAGDSTRFMVDRTCAKRNALIKPNNNTYVEAMQ